MMYDNDTRNLLHDQTEIVHWIGNTIIDYTGCLSNHLNLMDGRISRQLPELLPPEIKWNSKEAPQDQQTHIHHNGLDKAGSLRPRRDELAEPIAPDVLVDSDRDEQHSRRGLITIDGVCGRNRREGSDLDTCCGVSDDDDGLSQLLPSMPGDLGGRPTFQLHWYSYPNATTKLPITAIITYGIKAGNRISGSRIPPFFLVALIEIQSESGPFVARPMNVPIQVAKLKKPMVWLLKLYGGAANAWL